MPMIHRNYKQERKTAIARGETGVGHNSGDAIRHRARRAKEKQVGHKLPTSVQVDHKVPLKSGGAPGGSNLRLRSASSNMAAGGRIGSKAGKSAGGKKGAKRLPVKKP